MTEYFKKFTMDKDEVIIIDFGENKVYQCKYSDEAKSLCNRLNDLDYEKYNLKKENEQLKQVLKIYRKVACCGNCNYHNYDWYDDGDEFEVCEKGNDMSDYICEEWSEL